MSAIAASARVLRSSSAIQSAVRRSYSSAAQQAQGTAKAAQGHSRNKLYAASGISAVVGFDVTYIYYNYGPGSKSTTSSDN